MTYYKGMTIEEIADQSMMHSRWDEEHRKVCEDCYADWIDACMDMVRDAELDATAEEAGEVL